MKLPDEQSEAIRRLVKNCLCEASIRETDLAQEAQPWMSPATLYRLLQTDQILTAEQADILLHGATCFASFDPQQVWQSLQNPLEENLVPILEMICSHCIRIDNDEADGLVDSIAAAAAASTKLWMFGRTLPLFMLEDDLANLLLAQRVQRCSPDPDKALTRLRNETLRRREDFMTFAGFGGITDIRVVITLSSLVRLARGLTPFSNRWSYEIDSSIDSIIHDAILERGVTFIMLDDLNDGPARRWAWKHDGFASITLFEQGLLVKRKRGTFAARILDGEHSALAKLLVDRHRSEFLEAEQLACHGLKRQQAADFLRGFVDAVRRPGHPGGPKASISDN